MMRLMADKHGWSIEGQARPTGPDALPSRLSHRAITGAPYPGLYGSGYESLQPGTSGARCPAR